MSKAIHVLIAAVQKAPDTACITRKSNRLGRKVHNLSTLAKQRKRFRNTNTQKRVKTAITAERITTTKIHMIKKAMIPAKSIETMVMLLELIILPSHLLNLYYLIYRKDSKNMKRF